MLNRVLNLVRLSSALLATRPDMVCKSGYSSSDVVFHKRAAGTDADDHLVSEVAVCTRLCD